MCSMKPKPFPVTPSYPSTGPKRPSAAPCAGGPVVWLRTLAPVTYILGGYVHEKRPCLSDGFTSVQVDGLCGRVRNSRKCTQPANVYVTAASVRTRQARTYPPRPRYARSTALTESARRTRYPTLTPTSIFTTSGMTNGMTAAARAASTPIPMTVMSWIVPQT